MSVRLPFVLTLLVSAAAALAATPPRPNILWLVAEDTGPSAYSCYGGQPAASTPAIDRLAATGVRFDRFYTTAPVCSAARSAWNTGVYQTTLGAHQHRTPNKKPLPEGVRPLGEWFRQAGYYTANVREFPAEMNLRAAGKTDWNFIPAEPQLFQSDRWADLAAHQPFYAQINFQETHRDFNGDGATDPAKVVLPPYYPDHPVIRKDYAAYLDSARRLDAKVAAILARLEKEGMADNTVVIFMGDNGEAHIRGKQFCYEEGLRVPLIVRWPKGQPAPAHYQPGTVDRRLLEAIDMPPTLLSVTGAPVPAKMQGVPFLGDQVGPEKTYVFGARDRCDETAMRLRTVRDDRYRYIRTFTPEVPFFAPNAYKARQYPAWTLIPQLFKEGRLDETQAFLCQPRQPEEQLFDLLDDPHEIKNLATSTRPEHAAALQRLRGELESWITRTDDQGRFPEALSPADADAAVRAQTTGAAKKKKKA
ncbi:sulfatase family protein [Horticoccus sp. 23ND18S-11]|uniref:sulfatase family protein n=1 Tax=Horticoccus sp. 23ND18S-11 TaxID=3391832 RepID=UPI0039C9E2E5